MYTYTQSKNSSDIALLLPLDCQIVSDGFNAVLVTNMATD
jgi:hypothetical protein